MLGNILILTDTILALLIHADGINWVKHANPVLQVGALGDWDNGFLEGPSVIKGW
jgi:hypothetical protein